MFDQFSIQLIIFRAIALKMVSDCLNWIEFEIIDVRLFYVL
jgi:hypothetical protein